MFTRIKDYQMKSIIYLTDGRDTEHDGTMLTGTTRALRSRYQAGVPVAVRVRKQTISAIWRPAAG